MAEKLSAQAALLQTNNARGLHLSRTQMRRSLGYLMGTNPSHARYCRLHFAANISASCALLKWKPNYVSESESCDFSDDGGDKIPRGRAYKVYEPYVVEFPTYAAMEEEKFWSELLAFPWQRGRTERFRRRLERKYFPKHGLDCMLLPEYRKKAAEASALKDSSSSQRRSSSSSSPPPKPTAGFPDDIVYKKIDYPTIARALTSGAEGQESFRSQRSRPSSAKKDSKVDSDRLRFDTSPTVRTIRAPLAEPQSPVLDAEVDGSAEEGNPMEGSIVGNFESRVALSIKEYMKLQERDLDCQKDGIDLGDLSKPPILKHGMDLPRDWGKDVGNVVLIDKPKGWTSFTVCEKIRYLVRVRKVGHAGTLDPMATGLMVVCVGPATKLADKYQALTKVYTGTLRLGEATSSYDADSPVNERKPWEHITDSQIEVARKSFIGEIMQIPPMFSAIKVDGVKLYEMARRGEHIDVPARKVTVYEFLVSKSEKDRQELDFYVCCSKGTYVRSLCADFARALNSCAHLTSLRREMIGRLSVDDAWTMQSLVDTYNELYKKSPPPISES